MQNLKSKFYFDLLTPKSVGVFFGSQTHIFWGQEVKGQDQIWTLNFALFHTLTLLPRCTCFREYGEVRLNSNAFNHCHSGSIYGYQVTLYRESFASILFSPFLPSYLRANSKLD